VGQRRPERPRDGPDFLADLLAGLPALGACLGLAPDLAADRVPLLAGAARRAVALGFAAAFFRGAVERFAAGLAARDGLAAGLRAVDAWRPVRELLPADLAGFAARRGAGLAAGRLFALPTGRGDGLALVRPAALVTGLTARRGAALAARFGAGFAARFGAGFAARFGAGFAARFGDGLAARFGAGLETGFRAAGFAVLRTGLAARAG
jgi:hypothetical protein